MQTWILFDHTSSFVIYKIFSLVLSYPSLSLIRKPLGQTQRVWITDFDCTNFWRCSLN